ncbi:MAG: protein kinase, partial [Pirellulales bacterium]|nr:protein kinase [Pirellulales bacterium]
MSNMNVENHPTNDSLSQFALGNLPDLEFQQVEFHLHECDECWDRLIAGKHDDDAFVVLLRESAAHAPAADDTIVVGVASAATALGDSLAVSDRYELLQQVASGGMGVIWIAHDTLLNREVAVKVLRDSRELKSDSEQSLHDRFVRESQIVSSLQHPGIPPVYDLGRLSNGKPFLAMKLIRGKTLTQRMAEREPPSIDWLLEVFTQVCQTLAFAHSRGVVHRDLKPDNIMVGQFGETQIMDWGISEFVDQRKGQGAGARQAIVGTPAYMSPEQAGGLPCGPQADVFSLGSILCEMLTGAPAYQGQSSSQLMKQAAAGDVRDAIWRLHQCHAGKPMIELAKSCLAQASSDRPADAAEVARRMSSYLHSVQARLRAAELERAKAQARSLELGRRRRTQRWLALLAVCLFAVSLFAWRVQRQQIQGNVEQINAAIIEARQLSANAGAASEGARERLEAALIAAERAVRLSQAASEPALQNSAMSLRDNLVQRRDLAARLEQLQANLKRAMIFDEGHTVAQRYRNRQQMLRRAVAEERRSTVLFLEFRRAAARRSLDPPQLGPWFTPGRGRREHGRMQKPSVQEYASGKAHVFRYAELRQREYERSFSEFGVRLDDPPDVTLSMLSEQASADREMITAGLRMWFLFAADTRSEAASRLSELLDRVDTGSGVPDLAQWCHDARAAMLARDVKAIAAVCEAAQPIMPELPPELLWGLGCYQLRCLSDGEDDTLLRHAQRHFLDSFLLNRELARLRRGWGGPPESVPYITGALAVHTDYELSIQLAQNLIIVGKIDEYEIVRDRCFARYPNDPLMFADWGDLMAMHQRPEVFVTYERAIATGFPEPQVLLARMGQLFQRDGWHDAARGMYEEAL